MIRIVCACMMLASPLAADPVADVVAAANAAFDDLPPVRGVSRISGNCGADDAVNPVAAYCTSRNAILLVPQDEDALRRAYMVAHLYGHAVQVRHGVADFALGQIRARRDEEAMLRGLVTRQVECIAGFIMARAGLDQVDLTDLFDSEPFTGSHWGRNPLRVGPAVSIGLPARAEWFAVGQGGDLAACAPGEFTADLLLAALNP